MDLFDPSDNTYTSQPSLNEERHHFGCAVFESPLHDNRPVVIAAGGYREGSAEIFDYTTPSAFWEIEKVNAQGITYPLGTASFVCI